MTDQPEWNLGTWEGNRRRQHREFLALSFREKLNAVEQLSEVARFFAERRRAKGLPVRETGIGYRPR